ncbi:MAG: hypothetical protein IPM79_28980 [Polyangiaceae bacterium]|nr:hypothetical protein [Polyangiaceae bacterium]
MLTSLAFAMFVLERFEDVIALGLESVKVDLSIGGRFQIAKTLSNVGQAFARLGDLSRGLSFLRRAREAHERYADQDSRADTLLSTAGILIEAGDVDAAHTLAGDAGALVAVTGSVYDLVNERIIRACLARLAGDAQTAIAYALEARQTAEAQGLMSFHIYATAVEAAARVDAGEEPHRRPARPHGVRRDRDVRRLGVRGRGPRALLRGDPTRLAQHRRRRLPARGRSRPEDRRAHP